MYKQTTPAVASSDVMASGDRVILVPGTTPAIKKKAIDSQAPRELSIMIADPTLLYRITCFFIRYTSQN